MKMAKWILPLLLLVGCGEQSQPDNHGYGWSYDVETVNGVRIKYNGPQTPTPTEINNTYVSVSACVDRYHFGIVSPVAPVSGPMVIIDPALDIEGRFYTSSLTIVVRPDNLKYLKHEMVHYRLWIGDERGPLNTDHQSIVFWLCAETTVPPL